MKDVTLNQRDQAGLHVLNSVLEYQVPIGQTAKRLGVSERHARRMLAAYRWDGAAAWPTATAAAVPTTPSRPMRLPPWWSWPPDATRDQSHSPHRVAQGTGRHRAEPAHGAAHSHPRRHRQSPQPALTAAPFPPPADAPGRVLVQLDGSHHAWLEDRSHKFAVLLAVDDATGAVINAVFRPGEDTRGYFMLLEGLIQR